MRRIIAFIMAHIFGELIGLAAIVALLLLIPGLTGGWLRNLLLAYLFVIALVCLIAIGVWIVARIRGLDR
jgi:hypothetical protein